MKYDDFLTSIDASEVLADVGLQVNMASAFVAQNAVWLCDNIGSKFTCDLLDKIAYARGLCFALENVSIDSHDIAKVNFIWHTCHTISEIVDNSKESDYLTPLHAPMALATDILRDFMADVKAYHQNKREAATKTHICELCGFPMLISEDVCQVCAYGSDDILSHRNTAYGAISEQSHMGLMQSSIADIEALNSIPVFGDDIDNFLAENTNDLAEWLANSCDECGEELVNIAGSVTATLCPVCDAERLQDIMSGGSDEF